MVSQRASSVALTAGLIALTTSGCGPAAVAPTDSAAPHRALEHIRCTEAIERWRTALPDAEDRVRLWGNIGACHEKLGEMASALDAFREAQRHARVDDAPPNDPREARLQRLDVHLTRLRSHVARLRVTCNGEDARVVLDERPPVGCPATFEVDAGRYRITGTTTDGERSTDEVTALGGEVIDVSLFDPMWPWLAGGAAAVGAAVVVAVLIATADDEPPAPRLRLSVGE